MSELITCPECHGKGHFVRGELHPHSYKCRRCRGAGVIDPDDALITRKEAKQLIREAFEAVLGKAETKE